MEYPSKQIQKSNINIVMSKKTNPRFHISGWYFIFEHLRAKQQISIHTETGQSSVHSKNLINPNDLLHRISKIRNSMK